MTVPQRLRSARWSHAVRAAALAGAALALVVGGVGAQAADATPAVSRASAPPAAQAASTTGWVRLAHLSPDTTAVDIQLSALAGGTVVQSLRDIGYGAVSPYMALPAGTYVVAMVPTGGNFANPVIQASISITAGEPLTVAAYGRNADLSTAVFHDDLTAPTAGQSRVRVVQASTIVPTVDVSTSAGTVIATDAKEGTATTYASVPAGQWNLSLSSPTVTSTAGVDLAAGSVSTLFVLDNATGGLALKAVLDSSSVGDLPAGGIQTGGGGTAVQHASGAAVAAAAAAPSAAVPSAAVPSAAGSTSGSAEDRLRRLIDEVTGWVFLAAGVVALTLIRRRRARLSDARGSDTRTDEPAPRHADYRNAAPSDAVRRDTAPSEVSPKDGSYRDLDTDSGSISLSRTR